MFRAVAPPPERSFPPTLAGLNMAINTAGQPVDITTGAPFAYFVDADERINDMHKEAFHTAMRGEMKVRLAGFGITEHYITANNVLLDAKPPEKHIPVLMNSVSTVKAARDVIIVVGESGQDCGIFAWRLVRGEQGIQRGTAVGLAEAVKEYGEEIDAVPAMIFLNPGQLIYSHRENCAKTLVSWFDGPRQDRMQGFSDEIDEEENRLEGHTTAKEHIDTFLETMLPGMIETNTRLYFVVIGDGAEHVLTALNKWIDDKTVPPFLSRQIEAVTLICPQISTPRDQFNAKMQMTLASEAKSWVTSTLPLGTIIASPLYNTARSDQATYGGSEDADADPDEDADADSNAGMEEGEIREEQPEPPMVVTFSAGHEGVTETAFESCMGEVLKFLWKRREEEVDQEARFTAYRLEREHRALLENGGPVLTNGHGHSHEEESPEED